MIFTGFTYAEGCFSLSIVRDKRQPKAGWCVIPSFSKSMLVLTGISIDQWALSDLGN